MDYISPFNPNAAPISMALESNLAAPESKVGLTTSNILSLANNLDADVGTIAPLEDNVFRDTLAGKAANLLFGDLATNAADLWRNTFGDDRYTGINPLTNESQGYTNRTDRFFSILPIPAARGAGKVDDVVDAVRSGVRAKFDHYEVLTEVPITGTTRATHRASANQNFAGQLAQDVHFRGIMDDILDVDVLRYMQSGSGSRLRNPIGTEWHHPVENPNVMQLLRRSEHRNKTLQDVLHPGPNRQGGFGQHFGDN